MTPNKKRKRKSLDWISVALNAGFVGFSALAIVYLVIAYGFFGILGLKLLGEWFKTVDMIEIIAIALIIVFLIGAGLGALQDILRQRDE